MTVRAIERERGTSRRRLAAAVSALGVAIVMGGAFGLILSHDGSIPAATASNAVSAASGLRLWERFPVDASPRPLVLTGPAIIDPPGGFPFGNDKIAYISRDIELATALPSSPATVSGQLIITASDAFALLRTPSVRGSKGPALSSLEVNDVRLGSAIFSTDRGPRRLPAWAFTFTGVAEPASVLAIPAADRWPLAGMPTYPPPSEEATVSMDGRYLTLNFVGANAGSGPCDAEYAPQLAQSSTAVALSARQVPKSRTAPNTGCWLVGYPRMVSVRLLSPLGNRVLIDPTGAPIPLT